MTVRLSNTKNPYDLDGVVETHEEADVAKSEFFSDCLQDIKKQELFKHHEHFVYMDSQKYDLHAKTSHKYEARTINFVKLSQDHTDDDDCGHWFDDDQGFLDHIYKSMKDEFKEDYDVGSVTVQAANIGIKRSDNGRIRFYDEMDFEETNELQLDFNSDDRFLDQLDGMQITDSKKLSELLKKIKNHSISLDGKN